jgi:hypothetical protein
MKGLSPQEWGHLVRRAAKCGIAPVLYARCRAGRWLGLLPPEVLFELREISLQAAITSLQHWKEIPQMLRVLQATGIEVVLLKGAHLAEVVYANRALRPMYDVDILVRQTDLLRAEVKLLEMGYGPAAISNNGFDFAGHHHLPPLAKPGGGKIEIHWSIERPDTPFKIDVDGLWKRARPAMIAGVEVLVLSPEDLILHLCLHASFDHEYDFGIRSLWDIAEVLRHYRDEIDWEQVALRAGQWGVGKYVYLTLHLACELVGAAVPDGVMSSLRPDGFDPQVAAWGVAQIFAEEPTLSMSPNLAQVWGLKRVREKVALLLRRAFPPLSVMSRAYPAAAGSKWIFLYYPVRWKYLLQQYGRPAWRLARRDEAMAVLAERELQRGALRAWLAPDGSLDHPSDSLSPPAGEGGGEGAKRRNPRCEDDRPLVIGHW